jgi:ABC-2 type transport system permease protein
MVFAMLSLFLAAYLPNRRIAATVAMIILIVSYFGNNLANLVDALKNVQFLFPYDYFNGQEILSGGIVTKDLLILLGATGVFLALAILSFQRRNVTVGAWPWQRARIESA